MTFAEIFSESAAAAGISLNVNQLQEFNKYYELLLAWNAKINLTAITSPREVALKHFVDSLSCYDAALFRNEAAVVDVGTGAGFPGIPLKILRPDLRLTLLDSLKKRLMFLEEVVASLGLSGVSLVHIRAEEAGRRKDHREIYDVVLSRAVARLNVLTELCLPLVKLGGYFCALKGAQFQDEVTEAANAITVLGGRIFSVRSVVLPGLDDVRAVVYIHKEKSTPASFPRRPGVPEKKPL